MSFFAGLWRVEPKWPRVTAYAVLPFCLLAPSGAWMAYLQGEHAVLLIPIFDTVFAGWILAGAIGALRFAKSRRSGATPPAPISSAHDR